MENLIKQQTKLQGAIEKSFKNYKKANKQTKSSKGYCEKRRDAIEKLWEQYKENNELILEEYDEKEHDKLSYFSTDEFSVTEEMAFEAIGLINDAIEGSEKLNITDKSLCHTQSSDLRLPRVVLPNFTGDYKTWPAFHDLFNSLVNENGSLSPVQKLYHLKTNVSGEAEHLIRHMQITAANYKPAWELLMNRYNNKRALINAFLKTFMSIPNHSSETATSLKVLMDTTTECLEAIKGLDVQIDNWDPLVIYILVQKLSTETHSQWELTLSNREEPTELPSLEEFLAFIETRFRTLEAIGITKVKPTCKERDLQMGKLHISSSKGAYTAAKGNSCLLCKQDHYLRECSKFLKMTIDQRKAIAQKNSYCFNCLAPGHPVSKCNGKFNCRICNRRHHTLLHSQAQVKEAAPVANFSCASTAYNQTHGKIIEKSVNTVSEVDRGMSKHVLLATALVLVKDKNDHDVVLRALIDQGSEATFISEAAVQKLGLRKRNTDTHIRGVGGTKAAVATKMVELVIGSRYQPMWKLSIEALLLERITGILPCTTINTSSWGHFNDIVLADPMYYKPGRIDLLLGADVYAEIIQEGIVRGPKVTPLGQQTIFGWILSGEVKFSHNWTVQKSQVKNLHCDLEVDKLLRRFWELEEIVAQNKHTIEEERCEEIYKLTHRRTKSGRYIVTLPFNTSNMKPDLGKSRDTAVAQLMQMEQKFKRNPEIRNQYCKFMQDYVQQAHMEIADDDSINHHPNYLPHHAVMKDTSTTTKLRVVFDASRKTSNRKSLNDNLLVGPTVQEDLFSILVRWRKHRVVFTADIKQMYRQILVDEDNVDYQRIVWRDTTDEPIRDFRLLTVTYGTASAPYLATRTLHQLAVDEVHKSPTEANIVLHDFYVDDIMSGGDTTDEVIKIQQRLEELMMSGGFKLRKWASNYTEVLENIPDEDREIQIPFKITHQTIIRALGVLWNPINDTFSYKVNLEEYETPNTKRGILSNISRIYDPLGWLAPVTVTGKILMQNLWLAGLALDEPLPQSLETAWRNYHYKLKEVENIQIPRWISFTKGIDSIELHSFSDASLQAYAVCIYARIVNRDETVKVSLIASKTKVAPTKSITLPKLELCGALLATRLLRTIQEALKIQNVKVHCWTDSKIVLGWVRGHPSRWNQFVSNRVSEIQSKVDNNAWHYVSTRDNPADCGSRGITPEQLKQHILWWTGPMWLQCPQVDWPEYKDKVNFDNLPETRKIKTTATAAIISEFTLIEKYSSFSKLIRITAYCYRFAGNLRAKHGDRTKGPLSVTEIRNAKYGLFKIVQNENFREELDFLLKKKPIKTSSRILNLNPFLDGEGMLRVGGRLQYSELQFNEKHPIILSDKGHFIRLLVEEVHKTTLHGGTQLMLNLLRKTYWILNARNLLRSVIHKCIVCFRQTSKSRQQLMGNLPAARVTANRPFLHTGVDFSGPLEIKAYTGRGRIRTTKGYVAVFVCLSTKAIHLEAVSDLSANAFLAAFKRFTGRRGLCSDLYSDCGTNFVGASKRLSEEYHSSLKAINPEIMSALTIQSTTWHFIPPASPHFGGLWEAGVKSMKHHLRRITMNVKFTYEELSTILTQIEACLNSRPLCALTNAPNDCSALTPGHFLVGNALLTPPEPNLLDIKTHNLNRWQLLQQLKQNFWKRWSAEYLSRLQQRPKWLKVEPNVKHGELVLIRDERLPSSQWLLARIIDTHPGADGLVRVVTLKCKNNTFRRPITKICPLPLEVEKPASSTLSKCAEPL